MTLLSLTDIISPNSSSNLPIDTAFLRDSLEQGQLYLQQEFKANNDIVKLVKQRANFVDEAIRNLWDQNLDIPQAISLLAVGGYGRGGTSPLLRC